MKARDFLLKTVTFSSLTALTFAPSSWAGTIVGGVEVFDPDELIAGTSQAVLANQWVQYVNGVEKDDNPLLDTTGQKAGIGQSGPVFFLVGSTFGNFQVERTASVPSDKSLFLPLINLSIDNIVTADDSGGRTVEQHRAQAEGLVNGVNVLTTTINGESIDLLDLLEHRQQSPAAFGYRLPVPPEENRFMYPEDTVLNNPDSDSDVDLGKFSGSNTLGELGFEVFPVITDGYWLGLGPLPVGQHTIQFGGGIQGAFQFDITYNVTSTPVSEPTSPLSLLTLALLGSGITLFAKRNGGMVETNN